MKVKLLLVLSLLFVSALCFGYCTCSQDYLFEAEEPEYEMFGKIEIPIVTPPKTDILFVIDSSGSMAEEQEALRANLAHFIGKLAESSNDYQIAVLTPDINSDPTKSPPHCTCAAEDLYIEAWQNNKCCSEANRRGCPSGRARRRPRVGSFLRR